MDNAIGEHTNYAYLRNARSNKGFLNEFFEVGISVKPIKVVSHQIVTQNILTL